MRHVISISHVPGKHCWYVTPVPARHLGSRKAATDWLYHNSIRLQFGTMCMLPMGCVVPGENVQDNSCQARSVRAVVVVERAETSREY